MVLSINHLTGFGGGLQYASPMRLEYLQTVTSSTNATSYTFSSQNFGTPSSNRYIAIVTMTTLPTSTNVNLTSVTIGGVTPSFIGLKDLEGLSNDGEIRIHYAAVPTGSTGDIVLNYSGTVDAVAVATYAIYSNGFFVYDSYGAENTNPLSQRIELVAGGVILAGGISNTTTNGMTLTGLTEDVDAEWSTENRNYIAGSLSSPNALPYLNVGGTNAGGVSEQSIVGVSLYQPEKCTAVPIIDVQDVDGDSTNSVLTYTFPSMGLGNGTKVREDRIIVVAAGASGASGTGITGCTIGGNAATLINRTDATASVTECMSTFYLNVPTGETADIVITMSSAIATRCAIKVCNVFGSTGVPLASATSSGNNVSSLDVSLTIDRPCSVIGFVWGGNPSAFAGSSMSADSSAPLVESTALNSARSVLKTASFTETFTLNGNDTIATLVAWEGN